MADALRGDRLTRQAAEANERRARMHSACAALCFSLISGDRTVVRELPGQQHTGMTESNATLQAALAYAARGWAVFPCDPHPEPPRSKRPLVAAEKDEQGAIYQGHGLAEEGQRGS